MINIYTVDSFNHATRYPSNFFSKLDRYNIQYHVKNLKDFNKDDSNFLVIEIYKVEFIDSFLYKLKENNFPEGLKILFYYALEGFEIDPWFLSIQKYVEEVNLDTYFVSGNLDISNEYYNFLKKYNLSKSVKVIGINYFLSEYYENLEDLNISHLSTNLDNKKTKDFLSYNGKYRPHRLLLVADLFRHNLQNNYISLVGDTLEASNFSIDDCLKVLEEYNFADNYVKNFAKKFSPLLLDKTNFNLLSQNEINLSHYNDTYFSIVTETSLVTKFFTEKIYKPIFNQHPFVVLGPVHTLKYLKELGFETFPEMFDESYDNCIDVKDRYNFLLKSIISFCNLSHAEKEIRFEKVKSKLQYNKIHFIELAKIKINIFEEIKKYEG